VVLVDGTLNLPSHWQRLCPGADDRNSNADFISNRYARFLKRPIVTLSLLAPRPVTLAVAGEVNRPGTYTVSIAQGGGQGGQGGQFPTVTQAITLAGGITQSAAVRNVQITRRATSATEQVITVNLWELLQAGNLSQDISLRDGDTVFIPTVAAVDPMRLVNWQMLASPQKRLGRLILLW
jgi:polysaccharide export outer membrane protein